MRAQLDRTEQRVLGVMIEKELSVPDTYPITLNALVAGCNQKSNRDPPLELEEFEVEGALTSLCLKDWAARREGSRAVKYVHRADSKLGVKQSEKAILAELLLRGPQTPMELKTRVQRMGVHVDAGGVTQLLQSMARAGDGALVELLPLGPRERDARWRHLLGPTPQAMGAAASGSDPPATATTSTLVASVLDRLAALEARVAALERRLPPA